MGKVIILFGVSGCGKSLVGKKLSEDLEFKFCREATRGVVWMDLENNKPIGLTSLE